jgi:uncharacterized integral membrane protein
VAALQRAKDFIEGAKKSLKMKDTTNSTIPPIPAGEVTTSSSKGVEKTKGITIIIIIIIILILIIIIIIIIKNVYDLIR